MHITVRIKGAGENIPDVEISICCILEYRQFGKSERSLWTACGGPDNPVVHIGSFENLIYAMPNSSVIEDSVGW